MTISELKKICDEQVKKGNGDKVILVADDEEGNGYHEPAFGFTSSPKDVFEIIRCGNIPGYINPVDAYKYAILG